MTLRGTAGFDEYKGSTREDERFAVSLPPNLPAGNYTVFTAIFLDGNTINPTIGRMDFRSN